MVILFSLAQILKLQLRYVLVCSLHSSNVLCALHIIVVSSAAPLDPLLLTDGNIREKRSLACEVSAVLAANSSLD